MADRDVKTKFILEGDSNGAVTAAQRAHSSLKDIEASAQTTSTGLISLSGAASLAAAGLGSIGIVSLTKQAIDSAIAMEKLQRVFGAITGDVGLAGRELLFVKETADKLGLAVQPLTESYGRFLSAVRGTVNEGQRGRDAFVGISEGMSALGMTADEQSRSWAQLNQGIMKGKFELEDLKTINEAGLPVFKLMADSLGITTGELLKMQKEGKLLVEDVLPKLGSSMHETFGQAALEGAKGAQGEINKFSNAIFELKGAVGSALIPAMTEATRGLTAMAKDILPSVVGGTIAVQAELIRLGMLIDKAGGSITMFNYAFFKTLELATRFVTLGQFGDSFKRMAEDADRYNKMYRDRYNDKDKRLEELANTEVRLQNTMARLGGSAYTAADRNRSAGNKPSVVDDGKPKNAVNAWDSAHDKYLAYLEAYNQREIAIAKAGRDAILQANEQGYSSGLVSLGQYLQTKQQAVKDELDTEYYAALENLDRRQQELVKASKGDPRKSQAENAKDYHDALKSVETATTSLITVESRRNITLLKNSEDATNRLNQEAISNAASLSVWAAARDEVARTTAEQETGFLAMQADYRGNATLQELNRINAEEQAWIQSWAMLATTEEAYQARMLQITTFYELQRTAAKRKELQTQLGWAASGFSSMASIADSFYQLSGKKSKEAFLAYQVAKSGETIISTGSAAMKSYDAMASIPYVGPILGAAAAAAAIAAGAVQLQSIWSASPEGGGSLGSVGGSAGGYSGGPDMVTQPVTQPAQPSQQVTIVLNNPIGERRWFEDNLPEIIKDMKSRNVDMGVSYS